MANKQHRYSEQSDRQFMQRAIELAQTVSELDVAPNPRVGALIVEAGVIVAEGYHAEDGGPHAERVALARLGRPPLLGATMYVTLEPCSTHGRTGSCCHLILENTGIRRVVVGCLDPNPAHAGRAIPLLEQNGIRIEWGIEQAACEALNPNFNLQMRLRR